MIIRQIFEARRNPEVNTFLRPEPRSMDGVAGVVKAVEPFFFRDDAYLSMTNLAKIGVHPNTPYDSTPSGIYAYPLGEQFIVSQFLADKLPHASWGKYATVLIRKPTLNVLTDSMSLAELAPQTEHLDAIMSERFDTKLWDRVRRVALKAQSNLIKKEAHQFYRTTETAVVILMLLRQHGIADVKSVLSSGDPYRGISMYMMRRNPHRPRIWNGLLRTLGFDAVDDRGSGMVFPSEPFQICFLSTAAIQTFSMFPNGRSSIYGRNKEIKSAGHFFRLVSRGEIKPLEGLKVVNAIMKGQEMPDVSEFGSYDPSIRFSDSQLRTYVQWLRDTHPDFTEWVEKNARVWRMDAPRLWAALGLK